MAKNQLQRRRTPQKKGRKDKRIEYLNKIGTEKNFAHAIIIKNGRVLLGLRKYNPEFIVWTFPGGRCDKGETIKSALKREVGEEIGVEPKIEKLITVKKGILIEDLGYIYRCSISSEPKLMEPDMFLEWKWFTLDELPENIIDAENRELIVGQLEVTTK